MLTVEDVAAPPAEEAAVAAPLPVPPIVRETERRAATPSHTSPRPSLLARLAGLSTPSLFALALAMMGGGGALAIVLNLSFAMANRVLLVGSAAFALATLVALFRGLRGIALAIRGLVAPAHGRLDASDLLALLGNLFMAALGAFLTLLGTFGFSRGRQLRRFGRVLLPDLRGRGEWAATTFALDHPVPEGVAAQWRENGKTEHASVAAFARLTLDLMALGAPPALVAAANRDALDEIRHTEICFGLARALDGQAVSPAAFPQAQRVTTLPRARTLALAKLAVLSLVDGALHEGVSARIIAKLAQRCALPAMRDALREIAADEGRHAAHGWAVVAWCLQEGGRPVAAALLGAIRSLPGAMRSDLPAAAADGGWERWGIHGHALEAHEYTMARAHLIARVERSVEARTAEAA